MLPRSLQGTARALSRLLTPAVILSLWLAVTPAWAGSMLLLGAGGAGAAAPSFSLTFGSAVGINDTTHTTVDYGTLTYPAGATRLVLTIAATAGGTQTITGATIGGNALTHVSSAFGNAGGNMVDIWMSSAPIAGSSGDIQVTYGSTLSFTSAVSVYGLTTTTTTPAFSNSASPAFGAGPTTIGSVVVPAGGGGLVVVYNPKTFSSWTNAATDQTIVSGNNYVFGHTTGSGTFSVSFAWTGGSDQIPMAAATWGP